MRKGLPPASGTYYRGGIYSRRVLDGGGGRSHRGARREKV